MMVALARSGVRLMPSMPRTMAPATTKTKKRQTFAMTPDMVATRAPARGRARPGGGLVGDALEDAADHLGAVASHDERDEDDEEDAERADDEVRDRRGGVRGSRPVLVRRW